MFKPVLLVAFASLLGAGWSQEQMPHPTAASIRYHAYREACVEPSFGLQKVKALVHKIKEDREGNMRLSDKVYSSLTKEEKFTYAMVHGEDFSQICDDM